ncbi:hypothetical protein N8E89_23930 (plasmid) [Phyllobacterium sp. A18/5-2]|uniref:hypothetical protein n=1 Tax=Phyllobacterium sp. A18/5-2 TaxID=2978392 RepID=UPI0021C7D125|nr:hypothetical protein [Phyllobacterium sp. A18/5-2]UXN66233.1 hypothetical protein N8E89_23930 [Phyllobacterium sp. A18/5-2]
MTTRTKRSMAHFEAPFALRGLDGIQPVGDYDIDEDENIIEVCPGSPTSPLRLSSTSGQECQPAQNAACRDHLPRGT